MNLAQKRWTLACGTGLVTAAAVALIWWALSPGPEGRAPGFAPAARLGFLLEPSTSWRHTASGFDVQVDTNALGLRGPEVAVPPAPDRYRILVLGDSFAFGWGVELEQAWHLRMARALAARDGRTVEVVTAGVPGWGPLQQFVFLEQSGLDLAPDLVLWQLCTNDLLDMERLEVELDARRLPVAVRAEPPLSAAPPADWVARLEQLPEADRQRVLDEYRAGRIDPILREIVRASDADRRAAAGAGPDGPVRDLSPEAVMTGLRSGPAFGIAYLDHLVTEARGLCEARGVGLRLLLARARPPDGRGDASQDGAELLVAWAARQGPMLLDTGAALPPGEHDWLYLADDPHWAPAAHPLVAAAVAAWLASDPQLGLVTAAGR